MTVFHGNGERRGVSPTCTWSAPRRAYASTLANFRFLIFNFQSSIFALLALAVALASNTSAQAKTVVLTDEDCELMAAISAEAPFLSWAGFEVAGGFAPVYIELVPGRAFLIRYPIEKAVPKGQRITQAEWIVPVVYIASEQKVYVHRLIGDWGAGVSHKHRMVRPQKVEWHSSGAKGPSTDRAIKPSAVVRIHENGDHVINVTQDVELWYSGAKNAGWIMSVEDHGFIRMSSPVWTTTGNWKLRITYEPE